MPKKSKYAKEKNRLLLFLHQVLCAGVSTRCTSTPRAFCTSMSNLLLCLCWCYMRVGAMCGGFDEVYLHLTELNSAAICIVRIVA